MSLQIASTAQTEPKEVVIEIMARPAGHNESLCLGLLHRQTRCALHLCRDSFVEPIALAASISSGVSGPPLIT